MTDPILPINSVDSLHAHFAEWVRFLEAKGKELETQLAKLEARKAKASALPAENIQPEDLNVDRKPVDFLSIAFQSQEQEKAEVTGVGNDTEAIPRSTCPTDSSEMLPGKDEIIDTHQLADNPDGTTGIGEESSNPPEEILDLDSDSLVNTVTSLEDDELV